MTVPDPDPVVVRLVPGDEAIAHRTFAVMAEVFETDHEPLSDTYVADLLASGAFWAFAALRDGEVIGGLTAHTLPMTVGERSEVFLYDLAVRPEWQRRGVGRRLVRSLRDQAAAAGVDLVFVPADDDDAHALDFYRSLGGRAAKVTIFEFGRPTPGATS